MTLAAPSRAVAYRISGSLTEAEPLASLAGPALPAKIEGMAGLSAFG